MRCIAYIQKLQKLIAFESVRKIRFTKWYFIVCLRLVPKALISGKIISANLNFHRACVEDYDYRGKSGYIAIKAPAGAYHPEPSTKA